VTWRRVLAIAALAGPVIGFLSCGIVWHPDARTTFTDFPLPIGVDVLLADGTTDCGSGPLGYIANPIIWFVAIALLGFAWMGVLCLFRRWATE